MLIRHKVASQNSEAGQICLIQNNDHFKAFAILSLTYQELFCFALISGG